MMGFDTRFTDQLCWSNGTYGTECKSDEDEYEDGDEDEWQAIASKICAIYPA
jgi:hypothetical protein